MQRARPLFAGPLVQPPAWGRRAQEHAPRPVARAEVIRTPAPAPPRAVSPARAIEKRQAATAEETLQRTVRIVPPLIQRSADQKDRTPESFFARAAAQASRAEGRSAALLLRRSSAEARAPGRDPIALAFRGIATNLAAQAAALRAKAPAQAERLAHRLEQIAEATRHRASTLEAGPARALSSAARATAAHGKLLETAAEKTTVLIGRTLVRAFHDLAHQVVPSSMLKSSLATIDRAIAEQGISFHEAFAKAPAIWQDVGPLRCMLGPMLDISRGLSAGDKRLVNLARADLLFELRAQHRVDVLDRLRSIATPFASAAAIEELIETFLPEATLAALGSGGLGQLMDRGGRVSAWLDRATDPELWLDHRRFFEESMALLAFEAEEAERERVRRQRGDDEARAEVLVVLLDVASGAKNIAGATTFARAAATIAELEAMNGTLPEGSVVRFGLYASPEELELDFGSDGADIQALFGEAQALLVIRG